MCPLTSTNHAQNLEVPPQIRLQEIDPHFPTGFHTTESTYQPLRLRGARYPTRQLSGLAEHRMTCPKKVLL